MSGGYQPKGEGPVGPPPNCGSGGIARGEHVIAPRLHSFVLDQQQPNGARLVLIYRHGDDGEMTHVGTVLLFGDAVDHRAIGKRLAEAFDQEMLAHASRH